jgi:hypothetical protein
VKMGIGPRTNSVVHVNHANHRGTDDMTAPQPADGHGRVVRRERHSN